MQSWIYPHKNKSEGREEGMGRPEALLTTVLHSTAVSALCTKPQRRNKRRHRSRPPETRCNATRIFFMSWFKTCNAFSIEILLNMTDGFSPQFLCSWNIIPIGLFQLSFHWHCYYYFLFLAEKIYILSSNLEHRKGFPERICSNIWLPWC